MKEKWKDVEGFEDYKISNVGRIKRKNKEVEYSDGRIGFKNEKELSANIDKRGYKSIILFKNGETNKFLVHRLVAKHFCIGYKDDLHVNHKDEDKGNNLYNNLEWVTSKENCNHGSRNIRISEKQRGELNHYYKYIEHYETKPTLRGHFKDILKRKKLNFEDFEETFHSYTKNRKVNRKKYVYKRRNKNAN